MNDIKNSETSNSNALGLGLRRIAYLVHGVSVKIFKSSVLVDVLNYVGLPLLTAYGLSMFFYPWIAGGGSWHHVHAVWETWQSLNAGALAFIASLVAFNISKSNENRQRERDFVAAKAFLPSTLSGLMEYCSQGAQIFGILWSRSVDDPPTFEHPNLPQDYREVFSNCIRHADPSVGSYLSNILVKLQVHDARLRDAIVKTAKEHRWVIDRHTLISYSLSLGELYALMGNLFTFARGENIFQAKSLTWEDFHNAYGVLDLDVGKFFINENMNLQAFTKRRLERTENQLAENQK